MNFLIIGAGLSGSVIARILAENGFRCRVIEKEKHVAGNCHTERDPQTGILKHHFGPHTLHSDNSRIGNSSNLSPLSSHTCTGSGRG